MKKTKLLAPILATATIGSMIAPLVLLTSCNKNNSNIRVDGSTTAETSANLTTTTYTFDVANYDETSDDLEAEIVDQQSTQNVKVEIVSAYYDAETKKFVVIVNISKEEGTLNDSEEVSFSIDFKCIDKKSKVEKWINKINSFRIKHHIGEKDYQRFEDIDTQKVIVTKDKAAGQTAEFTFTPNDTWTKSETPAEGELKFSNLNVTAIQHNSLFRQPRIVIDNAPTTALNEDGTITVAVKYDTTNAEEHDFATFGLAFTYYDETEPESTFAQTIGGFVTKYETESFEHHIELASSRNRNYYSIKASEAETGSNFLVFTLDKEYDAAKFNIESSDKNIVLDQPEVIKFSGYLSDYFCLVVPYTLDEKDPRQMGPHFNVSFNIAYTGEVEGTSWNQKFGGFTFNNVGKELFKPLISCNKDNLPKTFTTTKTVLTNVFSTIAPVEDMWYPYAIIDDEKTATVTANDFTWYSESTKVTLDTTELSLAAGKHKVEFVFYIGTDNAAFKYTLTLDEVEFA